MLVVVALSVVVATLVIRALPLPNNLALVIAVGAPYVVLVALLGLVVAALSRLVVSSIAAVAVMAASLAVQVHWYHGGRSAGAATQHVDVRVLSANLRYGRANPAEFVELARGSADVITVTELTAEAVQRFYSADTDEEFPHSVLFPAPNAGGNGIWSRFRSPRCRRRGIGTRAWLRHGRTFRECRSPRRWRASTSPRRWDPSRVGETG